MRIYYPTSIFIIPNLQPKMVSYLLQGSFLLGIILVQLINFPPHGSQMLQILRQEPALNILGYLLRGLCLTNPYVYPLLFPSPVLALSIPWVDRAKRYFPLFPIAIDSIPYMSTDLLRAVQVAYIIMKLWSRLPA